MLKILEVVHLISPAAGVRLGTSHLQVTRNIQPSILINLVKMKFYLVSKMAGFYRIHTHNIDRDSDH